MITNRSYLLVVVAVTLTLLGTAIPSSVTFAEELPAPMPVQWTAPHPSDSAAMACGVWCAKWYGGLKIGAPIVLIAVATAASLPADAVFVAVLAAGATAYAVIQRTPRAGERYIQNFSSTAEVNAWLRRTCPVCLAAMNKTTPAASLNHAESEAIIKAYGSGRSLSTKGDGRSNGSIQLYAGVAGSEATIGGVVISGRTVNYMAAKVPVVVGPRSGFQRLGQSQYYYNATQTRITCAWRMTTCIGHQANLGRPLTVGEGLAQWTRIKAEYGLTIPVAVLYLP